MLSDQEVRPFSRRAKDTLTQKVEVAPTINRAFHNLELIHPSFRPPLAVAGCRAGSSRPPRLPSLEQLDSEGLQFGDTGCFGRPLWPLLQSRAGLLLALLLLVSEHPGELRKQGAASLRDPVDRLQPLECTIYVWYTSCTWKRCPGDTTKSW